MSPAGALVRPEWAGVEPYGAPQLDVAVRLNVNENPYMPPEAVRQDMTNAVRTALTSVNRYPDREATQLRSKLADYLGHGLTRANIWAANGSNEVIVQILQAFGGPGRSLLTFTPSYSMYPEYARDTHTDYVTVARTEDFRIDLDIARQAIRDHRPDVVILATPNNPTGTVTGLDVIEEILTLAGGIVIVDEAYQEFSGSPSALELLAGHGNLLVSRTMSKAFAFAGGRVGYVAAAEPVVDALRVVRLPYHLNAITQAVAAVALDHADEMLAQVAHLRDLRDQAIERLRSMGMTVVDTQANFFLFGPFADRHTTWQRLVDQAVLVRETGPEGFLRACAGTDQEMELFYTALEEIWGTERTQR